MGKLEFYSNYLQNAKTPNQDWRNLQQEFVSEMFENTTILRTDLYEEGLPFDFDFKSNPECWVGTVIDVTTGLTKSADDYRSLYFKNLEHDAPRGRYYKWNDNYWIVYETTTDLETIATCNIRRCNNWLKWLNDKGEVIQYPCVIENTLTSANAQVAKVITQANSHIDIIVQGNEETLKIYKNLRIMVNGIPYRFYSINNYMQKDYVNKETPMLFMDFYLDMLIDEDNVEDNLADDYRADYIIECNVEQITSPKDTIGTIVPKVYHNNKIVDGSRMEFFSSDEDIVTINKNGEYKLLKDGTANITVQILGNTVSAVTIPVTVEDVTPVSYSLIVTPNIKSLKQGRSKIIDASVIDNITNNEVITDIVLTPSGADSEANYTIEQLDGNVWKLTNNLVSKELLTLTFTNAEYDLEYVMQVDLRAML